MIDLSFLTPLGLFLLYLPPLFIFMFQKTLNYNRETLSYKNILLFSGIFTLVMMVLMVEAYYVFSLYFILFNIIFFYVERLTLDRAKALSLAVYVCFAVSVLWEYPIQITLYQNIDAVIMSSFKALGIIFFYLTIYKDGFRINNYYGFLLTVTLFLGLLVTLGIHLFGIHSMFYITHVYRLPWIILLLYSINLSYKPLNKDSVMLKSGLEG